MKKILALTLTMILALTLCSCGGSAATGSSAGGSASASAANKTTAGGSEADGKPIKCGILTLLNATEEEMKNVGEAIILGSEQMVKDGYIQPDPSDVTVKKGAGDPNIEVIYYDTLDSMIMALEAGEIDMLRIYYSTARYLTSKNDKLAVNGKYDIVREKFLGVDIGDIAPKDMFAYILSTGLASNDFAFMMMEDNTALRDEFDKAILDMKKDGTYSKLVEEQINDVMNGGEIKPVTMPVLNSTRTIKVAVTGSLPPMDYVAADGTPAGFNTAMLAEISKRIRANIELVVVDSIGRAAALSSGTVDAVFWTRTDDKSSSFAKKDDAKRKEFLDKVLAKMSKDQQETMNKIIQRIDYAKIGTQDMPKGTIITKTYYSDILVNVIKK
ncbi:MAG: transporter substrate-binding domain-containing protein [Lachnospiraceae bacterium]|nr:transporter substrate-binding domain-containing protein [Lachnospiraceae bacterium]